jgi:hypothetical protein
LRLCRKQPALELPLLDEWPEAAKDLALLLGPHDRPREGSYYLQRTRFESIAERKLRRRQLTDDGSIEISGRDLR